MRDEREVGVLAGADGDPFTPDLAPRVGDLRDRVVGADRRVDEASRAARLAGARFGAREVRQEEERDRLRCRFVELVDDAGGIRAMAVTYPERDETGVEVERRMDELAQQIAPRRRDHS